MKNTLAAAIALAFAIQSAGTDAATYTLLGSALLVLGFIARRKRTHR